MTLTGDIGIRGDRALDEAAKALGRALGVAFVEETTGRYEEFPAYCAEALGLHLALLGVPEPGADIRSEPNSDYALQVVSETSTPEPVVNISAYLLEVVKQNSDLECWVL
jgi:hypothetical protein